ncbi:activator of osmoprotectant transporter ProP [Beggiatoa alba B18LD]|uniref:Activator of osmoprotectant transporter ProP n=1 Tax=Beggiatoa alba B18LD TaxID=395493 RepID=I3CBV9_9GAMM|nr:ProQ/FinO family protein [Beggiatoa alba]EIJ41102.1 activator of osmoprotectant transporter ProP [Beggiatoa alba B18LD]
MQDPTQNPLLTKDKTQEALNFLRERFPKAFFSQGEIKYALAVGIRQDISRYLKKPDGSNDLPEHLSFKRISAAICLYCHDSQYQTLIKTQGSKRVDLEGNIVGEVTAEQVSSFKERRKNPLQVKSSAESAATDKYTAVIPVRAVKVTLPILSSKLPKSLRQPSRKPEIDWQIELANPRGKPFSISTQITQKSQQRMLKTIQHYEQENKEAWVLLQAVLSSEQKLKNPQLLVVEKKEKEQEKEKNNEASTFE